MSQRKKDIIVIVLMLAVLNLIALLIQGCAQVIITKTDGTVVQVNTFGTANLNDMFYLREPNSIQLIIGEAEITPEYLDAIAEKVAPLIAPLL